MPSEVPQRSKVRVKRVGGGGEGVKALKPRNFCRGARSPKPFTTWNSDKNVDSC